ncbi:MAG: class I SAM-dependent methyltransferase [Janthinobacterium lividum]
MNSTVLSTAYYDKNAQIFYDRTIHADMSQNQNLFLAHLKSKAKILDIGCGVGRDAYFFEQQGYDVLAFDGSQEMVNRANQILKQPAKHMFFNDINFDQEFEGAWAAASLLHVPNDYLKDIFAKIYSALKPKGIFFMSFKQGEGELKQEGRTFYYQTQESLAPHFNSLFAIVEIWTKKDTCTFRSEQTWLNILLKKI